MKHLWFLPFAICASLGVLCFLVMILMDLNGQGPLSGFFWSVVFIWLASKSWQKARA